MLGRVASVTGAITTTTTTMTETTVHLSTAQTVSSLLLLHVETTAELLAAKSLYDTDTTAREAELQPRRLKQGDRTCYSCSK